MLEELMNLVRQSGQESVVNNPAVPNEHNDAVLQEASSSIFSGLQNMLQQGGPGALKSLFQGVQSGDQNHPAVQQVASQFSGNLMQKFGLSSGVAQSVAASLIPMVLGKLMGQSQNASAGSGLNIGSILGSLMGGGNNPAGGGLGSLLGAAGSLLGGGGAQAPAANAPAGGGGMLDTLGASMGLDKNGDGHTDLKDLLGMFGAS